MTPALTLTKKMLTAQETKPRSPTADHARDIRRRMLEWPNPVEYVNNMYGCHPGDNDTLYFDAVFGDDLR